MAPRPHWKGYLKLSLVSCPIGLYPAISAADRISFRQVHRETGHRLRQQLVDSVTREVVEIPARSVASAPSQKNVINLMDALKRSLAAEQPGQRRTSAVNTSPTDAATGTKPTDSKRSAVEERQGGLALNPQCRPARKRSSQPRYRSRL